MSDQPGFGPVPPPAPPTVLPSGGFRVDIGGNQNSKIVVAAGSVIMTSKPQLPVADIPQAELDVVERAWVDLSTRDEKVHAAEDAVERLLGEGPRLAVVVGAFGYGKRTAGIKALSEVSRREREVRGRPIALKEIRPDWEKPGSPDISVLPDDPGTGYLLDVEAEIGSWSNPRNVAQQLVRYAEDLVHVGSYLVVIADEHGWPEDSGTLAGVVARAATRPCARRVSRAHLEIVHHKPERVRWLSPQSPAAPAGRAAHLLTEDSRPADGVRLATALAKAEDTPEGLKTALGSFQQWSQDVQNVFRETEQAPEDRALLISALFLEDKDALTIQSGAQMLLDEPQLTDVRTILTGPDLTTRLERMGAKVTGRTATLNHRPGYARAVLLHLWRQRADIHPPLLKWIDSITAPKELGADRLAAIGDLLVEVAIAERDIRVIDQIRAWIDKGDNSPEHRQLTARVLTIAAESDTLGAQVRALLLDLAQDPSTAVATVVALVCRGEFAEHYPRQSLVRLRHVLDREPRDQAVAAAQDALRDIAAREGHLPRVWNTVIKWATEKRQLAGCRAFLSLLDPQADPFVLQVMLEAAQRDPRVKEALVTGWSVALSDRRVDAECRALLIAWAQARESALVPGDIVTEILNDVVVQHLYSTPVSALIFGEPGVAHDAAVIELRKDLRLPPSLSAALPDQSSTAEV